MSSAPIRAGIKALVNGPSGQRDGGVRKVGARLALHTVALVLVLLIVLEGVVFVITQRALLGSLKATLRGRAAQVDQPVCQAFHLTCAGQAPPFGPKGGAGGPPGPGGGPGGEHGGGPPGPSRSNVYTSPTGPSEASATFVDRNLRIVHGDGVVGHILLRPADARAVFLTGRSQCCGSTSYKGQPFLVYSAPLRAGGHVVAAVQTSISEHQYLQTTSSLLRSLLIVAALGLLGSAVVSILLVGRALLPIRVAMQRQRDFVADAAHELRTPLAIQRTVAEVGINDASIDELRETVDQMLGENRHLTRLVEDLSLLARSDTDSVSIERQTVDLSSLLSDTAGEIGFLAEERSIALESEVQPHVVTSGDVLRLRQLLLILLDNAFKHTPGGGVVRVNLGIDGGRARLDITDSGEGIEPGDLPRIFDRFYQADAARAGEGTGLGLAIAKWIVEAHGGQIRAGNASPRGAVFSVLLPVPRAPATA